MWRDSIVVPKEELIAVFSIKNIVSQTIALGIATELAGLADFWMVDFQSPWRASAFTSWGLLIAFTLLTLTSRMMVLRDKPRLFQYSFVVQSLLQFLWLFWLCWTSPIIVTIIGTFMMVAWLYHDSHFLSHRLGRLIYALSVPTFLLFLLLVDLLGGAGLLFGWMHQQVLLVSVVVLLLLSGVSFVVMWETLAAENRLNIELREKQIQTQLMLTKGRTERSVIRRICGLLDSGVEVNRFSHDVRSPVSVLTLNLEILKAMFEGSLSQEPVDVVDVLEILNDMQESTSHIRDMTQAMAIATREPSDSAPMRLVDLIEHSVDFLKRELRLRGIGFVRPNISLSDDLLIMGSKGLYSAVGNVLVNCAVYASGRPVDISSDVDGEVICLTITDYGVEGEGRDRALEKILSRLELSTNHEQLQHRGEGEGYGIGLMLSRVQMLRNNGDLSVAANREGPGVRFLFKFQRGDRG